jgi:hypothetical protein
MIDPRQHAAFGPTIKIPQYHREWRKVPQQLPPLTTGGRRVKQRVHYVSQAGLTRPPQQRRPMHERFQQVPFVVRQIACITLGRPLIVQASGFSPGIRGSVASRKPMESQPTEIT